MSDSTLERAGFAAGTAPPGAVHSAQAAAAMVFGATNDLQSALRVLRTAFADAPPGPSHAPLQHVLTMARLASGVATDVAYLEWLLARLPEPMRPGEG